MHKVNLGLPVPGAPGNPTLFIAEARHDVDERDRRKRERERGGGRGKERWKET